MTSRNLAGEAAQTLSWDADQRFDQLAVVGGDITEFLYDADGARVLRHTGGVSTSFYPAGGTEYRIDDGEPGECAYYYTVGGSTVAHELTQCCCQCSDNGRTIQRWDCCTLR